MKIPFFVCVVAVYLLAFRSVPDSGDNIVQYLQTAQIADHHRLKFSPEEVNQAIGSDPWDIRGRFILCADGIFYSQRYGIGQSIATMPLFIGLRTAKAAMHLQRPADQTLWRLNAVLFSTLGIGFILGSLLCAWGGDFAFYGAFAAAFASPFWMYAEANFNNLTEACAVSAYIFICMAAEKRSGRAVSIVAPVALALLIGLGIALKPSFALLVPGLLFLAIWKVFRYARTSAAVFLGTLAVVGLLLMFLNYHLFGSVLKSGYSGIVKFDQPWKTGFLTSWLSPFKSPFYFFPLVLLAVTCTGWLAFRKSAAAIFVLILALPQFYLIPKYGFWFGVPDFYQRFWLNLTPAVFLVMAEAHASLSGWSKKIFVILFIALTVLGIKAQALTSLTGNAEVRRAAVAGYQASVPEFNLKTYRENPLTLTLGATKFARYQIEALSEPVPYLIAGSIKPTGRLWLVLILIAGALAFTYAMRRSYALGA